jgi:hypothetical protein
MHNLIVERPVELMNRAGSGWTLVAMPLICVTAAATVPFSATVMLASWAAA